jgi:hypothetical protein
MRTSRMWPWSIAPVLAFPTKELECRQLACTCYSDLAHSSRHALYNSQIYRYRSRNALLFNPRQMIALSLSDIPPPLVGIVHPRGITESISPLSFLIRADLPLSGGGYALAIAQAQRDAIRLDGAFPSRARRDRYLRRQKSSASALASARLCRCPRVTHRITAEHRPGSFDLDLDSPCADLPR